MTNPSIRFANATRERDQYRADLVVDGVPVGVVERGFAMGSSRRNRYSATIRGRIVADGDTLADLRAELREAAEDGSLGE